METYDAGNSAFLPVVLGVMMRHRAKPMYRPGCYLQAMPLVSIDSKRLKDSLIIRDQTARTDSPVVRMVSDASTRSRDDRRFGMINLRFLAERAAVNHNDHLTSSHYAQRSTVIRATEER
jgi:hypothetical protein